IMNKNFLKNGWERYRRKKRWWTIALDFIFIVLVVAMLFPGTRKPLSAFLLRQTLFSPSDHDKVVFLSDSEWNMRISELTNGEHVTLEKFQGRPVFLNFWATWCPPCIAEMPSIQELYDDYKDEVAFVLVSNESQEVIDAFMERHDYTLPVYSLAGSVPSVFETSTIPSTYFIAPSGRLLISKTGAARWNSPKVRDMIDDLLDGE
ncbi:MAG: TlpA family protein disulfide reductase, partial [Marinilabiliaceae bacterium]